MPISNTKDTSSVKVSPIRKLTEPLIGKNGLGNPAVRNLSSSTTKSFDQEVPVITSTWGIGWWTPSLMLGSYINALAIAITHLVLFRYLDGKEADGPNQIAPQSYISTASNILANIFGVSLRASLAVAFVQHLWHLLRVKTMKVSTIEMLFNIRSNIFILLRPAALRATPFLFVLAIFIWGSQVVTSFPPGAITVATFQKTSYKTVVVPTFNASFMGNGSGVEANAYSLNTLQLEPPSGFYTISLDENRNANLITRLAFQVLISGESLPMPSPCGANCSYVVEFEGPYFECNHTTADIPYNASSQAIVMYNGTWYDPRSAFENLSLYNGTFTSANFTSTTFAPLKTNGEGFLATGSTVLVRQDTLVCVPGRASFNVNYTYVNNIQTRTVSASPIEPLVNLAPLTHDSSVIVPGFCAEFGYDYGTTPANWSETAIAYYRDDNIMSIFDSLMSEIQGSFVANIGVAPLGGIPPDVSTTVPKDVLDSMEFDDLVWDPFVVPLFNGGEGNTAELNGTIIDDTRLNTGFGKFSALEPVHPLFNITEAILNDYLLNMTTSIMIAYGTWNTSANATIFTATNIYRFSHPLSLLLPYFISLGLAIPFILVGGLSLIRNGVSATDGSFIQIITTSTGSAILDRAAAGGCLGGDESVPQELKDLEIRFGEFIGREDPGKVKRAGFGVDSELIPLKKGENYGVARWI